jgi:hypothetical protein
MGYANWASFRSAIALAIGGKAVVDGREREFVVNGFARIAVAAQPPCPKSLS